jgi:uncharacterized protein YjbI with pentapeptide repeats
MARGAQRREVDDPDLPLDLDELGEVELLSSTSWEGVHAGAGIVADDKAYDVLIKESVLDGVDLRAKRLIGLTCTDVRFEECDLAGAVLDEARLTRVAFVRCRMTGTVLSGAALQDVQLTDCTAGMLALRMTSATYLSIADSSLVEADFYQASLELSRITGTDLSSADFTGARVPELELTGSTLHGIVGASGLRGAVITSEQLFGVAAALATELGITVQP